MLQRCSRAFTLIELLVVIAIIAILAAILFPVFAQAKLSAKIAVELSDIKQLALASRIYANDYDDTYPLGSDANFSAWPVFIQPYCKNLGILKSPVDDPTLKDVPIYDDAYHLGSNGSAEGHAFGVGISFGANAYVSQVPTWEFAGFFPHLAGTFVVPLPSRIDTSVTHPAETILFAPTYTKQHKAAWGGLGIGITSAAPWGNLFATVDSDAIPYGLVPDGHIWFIAPYQRYGYKGGYGTVSVPEGRTRTNFAFSDGHAKSMDPLATDPDNEQTPEKNMWNAVR